MQNKNLAQFGLALLTTAILAGCGSSSDPNAAPTFEQSSYNFNLNEDTVFTGNVVATDKDTSDTLNYTLATAPENGTLTVIAAGAFTYTPVDNFVGSDSAQLSVSDGELSATVTIEFSIAPVNDAPVIDSVNTALDGLTTMAGVVNASDVDGDSLTFSIVEGDKPNIGSVKINSVDGTFIYTAENISSVQDSFVVAVSDGSESVTQEIQVSASFATNEQKSNYYYANVSSHLVQAEALLVNSDEEGDAFVADEVTAAEGYEQVALGYAIAGFVEQAESIIKSKVPSTDKRAIALRKLAKELNQQALTLEDGEGKTQLITRANELRQTAVTEMNTFVAVNGIENLSSSNGGFYRDTARDYAEVSSTEAAIDLLGTIESFALQLESDEEESTAVYRNFVVGLQSLSEELVDEYLNQPNSINFNNAMLALELFAKLADNTSYNELNSGARYHIFRALYYSTVIQHAHFLSLIADGDEQLEAEALTKTYLAKAIALYSDVKYDEAYNVEVDEYASETTTRYPTGLSLISGPFAALYPEYVAANASETKTGNLPLDLTVEEEVKLTDTDVEKAYRDHFAYSLLLAAQKNESFTPLLTEMKAFFAEQSGDEEYIVEALTEQDSSGVSDRRGAWLLHYAGYTDLALSLVDEAVAVMQTDAYKEDVKFGTTYMFGSQGCYQMKELYQTFGGEQAGIEAIDNTCETIINTEFAADSEQAGADDIRYAFSILAVHQSNNGDLADALSSAQTAIDVAATNEDFDDFITEHIHVANSMVKAGLVTESLVPVTTALDRISSELTAAEEQSDKIDVIDDAIDAIELLTAREDDDNHFDIHNYLFGIKHHAGANVNYEMVRAEAESKIKASLDSIRAAVATLPTEDKQELYIELIELYSAMGEYTAALAIAMDESFTQADKEPLFVKITSAQATHNDFPATSVALIDTDKDGSPTFFLTIALESDITNSGLIADEDSDGDGVEDENDITPLTPNQ